MNKLIHFALLLLSFFLGGTAFGQSNLPACQGTDVNRWSNCFGSWTASNGNKYVGEFKDGKLNGQGTYTFADGRKYVGEFKDGNYNGQGTHTFPDGGKYVGEFKDGKFNGQGTLTFPNGEKYLGEFKDGKYNGQGTLTFPDGEKYVGEYRDDKRNGQGTLTFPDGGKYVGEFKDGKLNGQGTYTFADGEKWVGAWKDDKFNGQGIIYSANGNIKQSGIYKDNALVTSQYIDPNSFTRLVKSNSSSSGTEAQRQENERKAAQLEEERKRIEEEKRQIALERQRTESQKGQVQVAPDDRRRLALVIGNDNYSSMPRLNNAVNDAKSMTDALRQANFEVMSYNNLDKRRMEEVLRNFTGKLGRDDVGLFYFSGHGIQADNRNFLIPVAENVKKTSEVPYEGIDVNRVMDNLKDAKNALNIVVLDACRSSLPDARGGMSRGLTVTDAPQGSIIAYATSPGKTASDGDSGNSPYTKNLIKAMQRKGVKIEDVFKEVRQSVIRETNGEQTPSETSYLVGDFYFRP